MTLTFASPMPDIVMGIGVTATYVLMNVVMIGFLMPLPPWWGYLALISYMRWGFGALMINQFRGPAIDICAEVPAEEMITADDLLKYNETGTLTPPDFSLNGGVCSGFAALTVADEYMDGNSTLQDAFLSDEICPNGGSTAGVLFGPAGRQLTATCNGTNAELLQELMFEPLPKLPPEIHRMVHDMGDAILNFWPMGNGYDADPKFIGYTKWECLGVLAGLFCVFFVLFWLSTRLSIRMVKR